MATGWLGGKVKAVPSGDTLVIMGNTKSGPPPEKSITLAYLIAPRLARRDGKDEPFAWDSREFLRKQFIGKDVTFKVDYVVPAISNREFGTVFAGDTNVSVAVVTAGWAKVRPQGGSNAEGNPVVTELLQLEEQAQTQGLGIWNKTPGASEASIRNILPSAIGDSSNFDAMAHLQANKGEPLKAVVEQVRDGSTIRIYLLPEFQFVQVFMAGIQAPSMGRRASVPDTTDTSAKAVNGEAAADKNGSSTPDVPAAPLTSAQKLAASTAATANAEVPPDPYAREAKHFTETRVLHRDVRVVLEGVDKFNNLIGSVHYAEGDSAIDLALELVKQGLAKVVEWSANMLEEAEKRKLKVVELQAKKERLRMWTNYVPPASNSTAIQNVNFTGKVIEVVSGDCVVVADDAAPFGSPSAERRVNLSSIRAPKIGNPKRDEKPASYAREAKEYLRTRLIGQQVNVTMEYSRKIAATDGPTPAPSSASSDSRVMDFGSVFLLSAPKGEDDAPSHQGNGHPEGVNVAEMVVARGFASVVLHRDFEERSAYYDALLAAESRAKKGKKGIFSQKESPVMHVNDLTVPGSSSKARQFLPFLQKAKRLSAVVDYVLSGHRFKLIIPRDTCAIAFSLSGVRCPAKGERFAEEAISFMRRRILQREVEIEIETVDKTGTFLGTLWEAKTNVAVPLLEAGLAKLHSLFSAERTTEGQFLVLAEQRAKKQLLKVWEGYSEEVEEVSAVAADVAKKQEITVRVTEILGGGKFYVQTVSDTRLAPIQQQLEALRVQDKPHAGLIPKKGDTVIAKFSVDNTWNRALVVNAPRQNPTPDSEYEVFYIDYGNQEMVPLSDLRPLDSSIAAAPGLGQLCSLAFLKVPDVDEDLGVEAAEYLAKVLGGDKTFKASIEEKDTSGGRVKGQGTGSCLLVTLKSDDDPLSVNADMLQNGYARLEKRVRWHSKEKTEAIESLEEHQEAARKKRLHIWQYGDVESDDEESLPSKRGAGRGRGR